VSVAAPARRECDLEQREVLPFCWADRFGMQKCEKCGKIRPDSQDLCDCESMPIQRRFRRGYFITIAIALLFVLIPWAWFILMTGFQDSMGNPRNTTLAEHLYVYAVALMPLLVPAFLIYWAFRPTTKI
jgi:hypothetical protein